jgi:hypothetical protein
MILCIDNFLEDATITPNLGDDLYPGSNLFSDTLYGQDGITKYITNIVIDLGSAKNVKQIGIMRSSSVLANLTIEANSSDSWGAPAFSTSVSVPITEINQTYRYWRIVTSDTGSQYIGFFYLGDGIKTNYLQSPGTVPDLLYNDAESVSPSKRSFSNPGIVTVAEVFQVPSSTQAEFEIWHDFAVNTVSHKKPFIFAHFEEEQTLTPWEPYLARATINPSNHKQGNFQFQFTIREIR